MAKQLFANNVSVTINEELTATDTTITVSSTASFPTISGGDWIMATIVPQGGQGSREVIKITAISGNNLTVVRGQEGTTGQSFLFGSVLELRVTKGSLEELRDFTQTGAGAIARTKADRLKDWISVKDFGATGDGVTNDRAAIQAAVDALSTNGGTLWFPVGVYSIGSAITLLPRVNLLGPGGHLGARIVSATAINLFQYTNIDNCVIEGLAFDGSGSTAFRQTGVGTNYTQSVIWRHNHFYGQLFECIYGNLILCNIEDNTFGYYGTVGTSHRHVVSLGSATNLTNVNRLHRNRFFFAKGNESIRFDSGEGLSLMSNNWEQNTALPVRLNGLFNAKVVDNYFEANTVATSEIEINAGTHVIDSQPVDIRGNEFHPSASITNLVKINNALSKVSFDFNTGGGMAGKTISNDASKIISQLGNTFAGLTTNDVIRYELTNSAAYDPPNLVDGSGVTVPITVVGAALGDRTEVTFSLDLQGVTVTSWVSATDTVSARFQNETGGAVDLAAGTLRAWVKKAN